VTGLALPLAKQTSATFLGATAERELPAQKQRSGLDVRFAALQIAR
jgi:hypothetical protein